MLINRLTRYILKGQRQPIPSSLMWDWGWSQKPLMWTPAPPELCLSNSPSVNGIVREERGREIERSREREKERQRERERKRDRKGERERVIEIDGR